MFLAAFKKQTDAFTDLTYSVSFILGGWLSYWLYPSTTALFVSIAITLWAIRLGLYLGYRVHLTGKDHRFDDMRPSFIKFGGFWLLQASSVCLIMLPVLLGFSQLKTVNHLTLIIGLGLFLVGLFVESIADYQKFKFRQSAKSDEFCGIGLWRIVQHPNYLGEIICWWSVLLIFVPHLSGLGWLAMISPLWITFLLTKVSGIPLLQASWAKKYGHLESFRCYQARTPLLIPGLIKRALAG